MKVEANVLGGFMGARLSCMHTIQTRTPHKGLYVRESHCAPLFIAENPRLCTEELPRCLHLRYTITLVHLGFITYILLILGT